MGEKEFNELSLDELEQVAGGLEPPTTYKRKIRCEVRLNLGPRVHYGVIVSGNIPLKVGDYINVPVWGFDGAVTAVEPGASPWDNAIIIYFPQPDEVGSGFMITDVYVI